MLRYPGVDMKRIAPSLSLLLACGDDSTSGDPGTSSTTGVSTSSSTSTGEETTSESSSSGADSISDSSSTGDGIDVVSCVALPNELPEIDCDPSGGELFGVKLCVGDAICEFTNACECVAGEVQVEMRTLGETAEVRTEGDFTIADCGEYEPIGGMGAGCTNLPVDTDLAFTLDDGIGNQVALEVRKNGSGMGSWRLIAFQAL